MCGMTGWMSFARNLSNQHKIAQAMTDTLTSRGPDAEGVWLDDHIALGHRRLSVIDLEGGAQPMTVSDASGPRAVISYTGEVYNYRELRDELMELGYSFNTKSDTEVVLTAYLAWGDSFAERLNGIYAFAIWDVKLQELLLVRDRMGVKPLYYYPLDDEILFASEPKAILAHPDVEAVVDVEGLQEIFSIVKTPGHAIFQGMFELKPGTILRCGRTGTSEHRYWSLEAKEHTDDLPNTIGNIRDLMVDIVDHQVVADVPLGTLLSGGLDSSAITVLAANALKEKGATDPFLAFSIDFDGYEEQFSSNVQWEDPDTPFAVEVAKQVNAEHINVMLNNDDIMDSKTRRATLKAQDLPISTGDMEYSLYLLCKSVKDQVTVALSGEGSDELFGGYTWFHDPEAVALDSFPWHHPFEKAGGIGALQSLGLWDSLNLGSYIESRYQEAVEEMPRLEGESDAETRMRQINYLNLTRWENFLLDRSDRISGAAGLEIRVPFTDHRLVEYVFNTPWAMKSYDGREKSLLREAMRGLVPDSVLDRKKSPYPSTQDQGYELALRERVKSILTPDSPVLKLIPRSHIQKMLDAPQGAYSVGGPWSARAVLERLVEFGTWVREYDVTVDLGDNAPLRKAS
ncbi:asparagine synthase (glutamine-hydrolyzing) [Marinimicrobium locisalis]|uniref:asparagine synthase (glutamine-hydrolyzing) n=1 Tax=Marinimicrobium locisalis TaxID=546022 RepID=UPI003221AB0E